jgi:hypothetical protein
MPSIDFAALRASRQRPTAQPQPQQPQQPQQPRRDWLRYIAFAAVSIAIVWLVANRQPPGPGPSPIDADGLHVLIVRDPDATMTPGQSSVVNSTIIPDWAKANEAKYRRFDAADDLSSEDRVWREMRATVTTPPAFVTLRNGRANVGPIPDGIDAAKAQLERLK